MPQQAWSKKRERQYEHIKEGLEDRGESEDEAEEIAARTVNKERARAGESKQASKTSTDDISSGRRGGLRSHKGPGGRTTRPAVRRGEAAEHQGPLEDEQGAAREGGRPLVATPARVDAQHGSQEVAERSAQAMWAGDRASQGLGMELVEVGPGRAVLTMAVREDMVNGHDIGHGGLTFTLADSAFAFACNSYNRRTVAAGAEIRFRRPTRLGDVLSPPATERSREGRDGRLRDHRAPSARGRRRVRRAEQGDRRDAVRSGTERLS